MVVDGRTVQGARPIETDVCIVGAGAAGITLARELRNRSFRVCLVESGGFEYDAETQALYKGTNIGLPYFELDSARVRYFGGSTNHWSGWCTPLDAIDFEARNWVPESGWPFGLEELVPYYRRAQTVCQVGPFEYDGRFWETADAPRLPLDESVMTTRMVQFSAPAFFGHIYRADVTKARNITTLLYSNVLEVHLDRSGRRVTHLSIGCLNGNRFSVSGRVFVLATGGIENARLLLASTSTRPAGVGNEHDLVGRYFAEHPQLASGAFILSDPRPNISLYRRHDPQGVRRAPGQLAGVRGMLVPSASAQRREKVGTVSLGIKLTDWTNHYGKPTAKAILRMDTKRFVSSLRAVVEDFDALSTAAYRNAAHAVGADAPRQQLYEFSNVIEQSPNRASRISLSDEKDALGMPRVRLDWRLNELDKRTMRVAHQLFGCELARRGLGRMLLVADEDDRYWPPELEGGWHHMGTTRMHRDAKRGVVDADCKVHGIANLYVAGSSVFPSVGWANPTLTIVALAIRFGDHLRRVMA